jgi:hypothetical protein
MGISNFIYIQNNVHYLALVKKTPHAVEKHANQGHGTYKLQMAVITEK